MAAPLRMTNAYVTGAYHVGATEVISSTRHATFASARIDGNIGIGDAQSGTANIKLMISYATGTAAPVPVTLRLRSVSSASDWSITALWSALEFYCDDSSGTAARGRFGMRMEAAAGAAATFEWRNMADTVTLSLSNAGLLTATSLAVTGATTLTGTVQVTALNRQTSDLLLQTAGNTRVTITNAGLLNLAGGTHVTFAAASAYSSAAARIQRSTVWGLAINGAAGSTNDFTLFNPAGTAIIQNPTGTLSLTLGGALTISSGDLKIQNGYINAGTAALSDTAFIIINGGGGGFDASRGGVIAAFGKNHATNGSLSFYTSDHASATIGFYTGAASTLRVSINGSGTMTVYTGFVTPIISRGTTDGADNSYLALSGGGDVGTTRGGHIYLFGNEHGGAGQIQYVAGDVVNADHIFYTGAAAERLRISRSGNITAGSATVLNWHTIYRALQLGATGAIMFTPGGDGFWLLNNAYYSNSAGAWLRTTAGLGTMIQHSAGAMSLSATETGAADSVALWRTSITITTVGTSPAIGFLGAAAIVRPTVTGSISSGAALTSLLTALANLGLITNSTSTP